jgi:hypothetical protein
LGSFFKRLCICIHPQPRQLQPRSTAAAEASLVRQANGQAPGSPWFLLLHSVLRLSDFLRVVLAVLSKRQKQSKAKNGHLINLSQSGENKWEVEVSNIGFKILGNSFSPSPVVGTWHRPTAGSVGI